jgi:hypothetical protein
MKYNTIMSVVLGILYIARSNSICSDTLSIGLT